MPHFQVNDLIRLLLQIAVVIAVTRGLGFFLRHLGQPLVIAEVVGGILLGPSFLGWLWPEAMATLFPATSMPAFSLLSQLGLVLFMFLVGLELDPALLRGRAKSSILIGQTTIALPFLLGVGAAFWLHERYSPRGIPFLSFALFLGIAMSITAFPVLARILTERNLFATKVGAIAITCAAANDVTAWCILSIVVAISRANAMAQAVWTIALAMALIAVLGLIVRPLLRRWMRRGGGEPGPSATLPAVALLLLLAASAIAETIGIHALFGAFLVGAIFPRGRLADVLEQRLGAVAMVLLLPLFFASSGLRTDIGLLAEPREWLTTLLLILLATAGKFGGSTLAARATGLDWRESSAIGILMNTRGLMELVALNIGRELGVISPTMFTMLVIMALVTTLATSPALGRVYRDRELARQGMPETS